MRFLQFLLFPFLFLLLASTTPAEAQLNGPAADLYRLAKSGHWYSAAEKLHPELRATSDGKSFLVIWKPTPHPKKWIVSLHGSEGFATDDLALWSRHLDKDGIGVLAVQWWLGPSNRGPEYYSPEQIYREIDRTLEELQVVPGTVMLHGFSRGSANSYAVAALDSGRGKKYFSLSVASSGGVGLDFPPNLALTHGQYGAQPLKGTHWVTVAGGKDPNPERDGIPGMRRAASWLKEQGAIVEQSIEDESEGHGALMRNPQNAAKVLDRFLKRLVTHSRPG